MVHKFSLSALIVAGLTIPVAISAFAQNEAALVGVETVEDSDIFILVPLNGTVTSARVSPLSPEISGMVASLDADSGTYVERGATVARLDNRLAALALRQAEAATRESRASLQDARQRLAAAERLSGRGTISEQELLARRTEVEVGSAVFDRLQAEEESQALRLALHEITAPFAGVVSRRLAEEGSWIEPGSPVVELVDMENLRIDVPVPQEYFHRLTNETPVSVSFDALTNRMFEARLQRVVPVSNSPARTFVARVVLSQDSPSLIPGMSARVTLRIATGDFHTVISRDGLIRYPDGRTTVWVVDGNGDSATVAERPVELGLAFDGKLQVRGGLEAGERIVVVGGESLRPGQIVRFEEASS